MLLNFGTVEFLAKYTTNGIRDRVVNDMDLEDPYFYFYF